VGLKRNTAYNIAGAASSIIVALVTIPPYLHQIGEARYGVLALVWLMLGYFGLFDLGLSRATANHIARMRGHAQADQEAVFWTAMLLNLGLGVVGGLVLYFVGGPALYHWLKASPAIHAEAVAALPWIAAAVPVATSTAVMTGALIGKERFGVVNLVQVGGMLLFQTVPLLVAITISPALYIIIPAAVLSRSVVLVPLFLVVKRMLPLVGWPRLDRARARELLGYGAWVSVTNIVGPILSTFDRFLIGVTLGASSVAYYDVPFRLAQKATIVPSALSQALFPRLSAQRQVDAAVTSMAAARAVNGFMTTIAVTAMLLIDPFLTLWVGPGFAQYAAPAGAVLLAGTWINSVATIPYAKLQADGRPKWVAMTHVGEVVPYVLALWWALHQFGILGAAFVWTGRVALDDRPVGEHNRRRDQIVDRQAERATHVADAAAERETADAGGADDPDRKRESVRVRRREHVLQQCAAADARHLRGRVDRDLVHCRQIDHEPVVDAPEAAAVVTAAAHRDAKSTVSRELDRCRDIRLVRAVRDRRRILVDHRVEEGARLVVVLFALQHDPSLDGGREPVNRSAGHTTSRSC